MTSAITTVGNPALQILSQTQPTASSMEVLLTLCFPGFVPVRELLHSTIGSNSYTQITLGTLEYPPLVFL